MCNDSPSDQEIMLKNGSRDRISSLSVYSKSHYDYSKSCRIRNNETILTGGWGGPFYKKTG